MILALSLALLSNELVVNILDVLASSDRQSCLALCLVSSWTRRIALPYLLRTVIITERNCTAFNEGAGQHSSYVKRLWVAAESGEAKSILESCASITALAALPSLIPDHSQPFRSLTHLCILHRPLCRAEFTMCTFPSLTHFAGIVYSIHGLELHWALLGAYGAQLVMVVVRVYDGWDKDAVAWVREVRKGDRRVYLMNLSSFGLEKSWMDGKDSVWDRARRETRSVLGLW